MSSSIGSISWPRILLDRHHLAYSLKTTCCLKERMMGVNWSKDIDQTLAAAKEQPRSILLDFSAAPA